MNIAKLRSVEVRHKKFGAGKIEEVYPSEQPKTVRVSFAYKTAQFEFPKAFIQKYLVMDDEELEAEILRYADELEEAYRRKMQEEQRKREEESKLRLEEIQSEPGWKRNAKRPSTSVGHNVAFKLNYCNGGKSDERLGYYGICSESVIRYNIEVKHREWCSNKRCSCFQYYCGERTYQDILTEYCPEEDFWPCYESVTLQQWVAYAGANGDGTPRPLRAAEEQSLCILTTVSPNMSEKERRIFAAFLIGDVFQGDDEREGYVAADQDYRLEFSPKETNELRFWDFYTNQNHPESKKWGSGLIRYFDDATAVKMLSRMVEVKAGKAEEQKAKEMLDRYIELHKNVLRQ